MESLEESCAIMIINALEREINIIRARKKDVVTYITLFTANLEVLKDNKKKLDQEEERLLRQIEMNRISDIIGSEKYHAHQLAKVKKRKAEISPENQEYFDNVYKKNNPLCYPEPVKKKIDSIAENTNALKPVIASKRTKL